MPTDEELEQRVLLLAPTARDADVTRSLLSKVPLECTVCADISDLSREIGAGAGAALVTEEIVNDSRISELLEALHAQPPWSELPVVVLMQGAAQSPAASEVLRSLGNVTLLERPAPMRSVMSAVQAAVRGRSRQYEIRDQIDEIRRAEAALRDSEARFRMMAGSEQAARSEAERAGRMKDEFLATLSHELRTPLNAILGWSQLLRRSGGEPEDLEQGLETIERNARAQAQLIDDLLDMNRIVSGKLHLETLPIEPRGFIEAAIETVRPAAEAREIRLLKFFDSSAGLVSGDANRLQQVVWNLLSNAIKFTGKGGEVRITLERVNSQVQISVSDTGQGINREFLPHVFERFRQADASASRRHGGLGLGLSIVKHLVELHGGTVLAESPGEGRGSLFVVSLPVAAVRGRTRGASGAQTVRERSARGTPHAALQGIGVLAVDDEPDARELIRRILEDSGADVRTSASAAEALSILEKFSPDVIVSDIGMPDLDGYEFLRRVRAFQDNAKTPAIALTAFARSEDRTRALRAGFLAHVSKPVEPAELIATVASVAGRTS